MISTRHAASLCALVILALGAGHAAAQLRFIDRVNAKASKPMQVQREAIKEQIARGTFKLPHGHRQQKRGPPVDHAAFAMPHWTSSFRVEGVDYPFTVIGRNPADGQATVTPTVVIPYRFVFADGSVVDATQDVLDGRTPIEGALASPIFNDHPFMAGPTPLGTTQFGDAYMRGNFWSLHGGQNSGYHTRLEVVGVLPNALEVNVPASLGFSLNVAGQTVGVIDADALLQLVKSVITGFGIPAPMLSVHLTGQLITIGSISFAGIHDWFDASPTPGTPDLRTFIVAGWFSQAVAPGLADVQVLAHEVVEWLMDPLVTNLAPPWQDPVTQHVCTNPLLEVADPLEDLPGQVVSVGGQSFTLPDVAFLPWFARISSKYSVNGWYSLRNTLRSASGKCPFFEYVQSFYFPNDIGMTEAQLTSINNRKQATGYFVQFGVVTGFVFNDFDPFAVGQIGVQEIKVPGSQLTLPTKISDAGHVVGFYVDGAGNEHGFLLSGGQYTTIDFPGALATEVLSINDMARPVMTGDYVDAAGVVHGFALANGNFRTIDFPGAALTTINGIDNRNRIVGRFQLPGSALVRGFTGNLGTATALDYLGDPSATTLPGGISNAGIVAGTAFDTGGYHGFLFGGDNFVLVPLDLVNGVNDQGVVAGSFINGGQLNAAFGIPIDPHVLGAPRGLTAIPISLKPH